MKRLLLGLLALLSVAHTQTLAADSDQAASEAAIRKMVAGYVEAFNKHDAEVLAKYWSPDAIYIDRATGEEVSGHDEIAKRFTALFKDQPDSKMTVNTESVRFVSPNVAVEQGTSVETIGKNEPEEVPYTAVYMRRDGQWLLDRVTDQAKEEVPSHYEQLKMLEWMVGSWADKDDDDNATIETVCNWTKNRSFLTRSYTITVGDEIELSGMQIVGWDPAAKTIRSWTFDSDGGFAEATWENKKVRWYIRNHGILADGRKATMTNVIKKIDDNSFSWQTIERTAGGEILPNIDEVVIVRER
ncbi:MAG TPA: nuclear transport factor 2 family protein [Pirellulales bacterium]|jgi:uncharacterized protein (TIGR02246 family)|nr:nuclear transport factor 2 family protein [Pirellulales bacterium]